MNKDALNDDLLKVYDLSSQPGTVEERLKLLLPYKNEMDDLLKKNPRWVSFISPIEKDLFDKLYPEKEKWIYTDFPIAWYYSLLSNVYMDLEEIDDYLKCALKTRALDPTCAGLTMEIITIIDQKEKAEYYPHVFPMLLSFPKYSTDKNDMANYYYYMGLDLKTNGYYDAALACFYLSNQFVPDKIIQGYIQTLSKITSYSKATSAKNIKLYSKRHNFAAGFSKEVKNLVLDCTTSSLACKDKEAFVYYLEILAGMDEAYLPDLKKAQHGKKTSLVPNPNPIKTCFRELTFQKEVEVTHTFQDVREFLKLEKQRITEKKNEGMNIEEAFTQECLNLELNSITSFFYLYCLYHLYNLEVPKSILTELEKNHDSKDMNQYEAVAKEYAEKIKNNPSDRDENMTIVLGLYFLKNLPLDILGLSFYFSGYSIEPSFLMKTKSTQKKSRLPLFNEKGEKYEFYYDEKKGKHVVVKKES